MVLDPLGVELGLVRRHAEPEEEGEDDLVALSYAGRELAALSGELDGAVFLGGDEAAGGQADEGARDGDVRDAHHAGEFADAGLAVGGDELGDGLDVVLGRFKAVGGAGAAEARGAGCGRCHGCGGRSGNGCDGLGSPWHGGMVQRRPQVCASLEATLDWGYGSRQPDKDDGPTRAEGIKRARG